MIVFRRIVAVFLALVFVVLFVSLLLVSRVNSTAGSPDFYINQLRQADIYNFVYSDVLPAALERTEIGNSGFNLSWAKPQVLAIAKQTAPPEWLQAQTEGVITAVVPYVLGDTRTLAVSIPLRERVQAGASAVKSTLHAAFIAFIIFGPVFSALVQSSINAALAPPAGQADVLQTMLAAKGAGLVQNAIDTFVGGLRTQAIVLLVVALGLTVLGAIWHRRKKQT